MRSRTQGSPFLDPAAPIVANRSSLSVSTSDDRIRELEDRLAEAERQRDALEKDVEALCMQNGEFSGSDVLANRISHLEQSLRRSESKVATVSGESERLRGELRRLGREKAKTEEDLGKEQDRNAGLEKELQYYLVQSGTIIAERDSARLERERAAAEASEARSAEQAVRSEVASLREKLEGAVSEREALEQRCVRLSSQAAESEKLEPLRAELERAKRDRDESKRGWEECKRDLETAREGLCEAEEAKAVAEEALSRERAEGEGRTRKLEEIIADAVEEKKSLRNELENTELVVRHLKPKLEESNGKVDTLERLRKLFHGEYRRRSQLISEGGSTYEELSSVDADKIEEILRGSSRDGEIVSLVSDWTELLQEILEAQYESAQYKQLLAQAKVKLAQATAEKVDAMLKLSYAQT